jgi:Zn-dependent protease with chaperone function
MPDSRSRSIIWRAIGAVALVVGFYGLAAVIVAVLGFLAYAQFSYARRINIRLLIFCGVGAITILWSIIPRRDRFVPPGARLKPDKHPRLFKELDSIAEATAQEKPAEVYLIPDVNAWVSQRGGTMGLGGRRVMGIGLALLHSLTISEFRAVLVHEFGHYYGGDTALGPWVYKTRAAIVRTISGLRNQRSVLQTPFILYGKMFLRITHAVSREQEYAADRLAAGIAGSKAMMHGLRTIHKAGLTFQSFWANEFIPVLTAGFHAPMLEGFRRFAAVPAVDKAVSNALTQALENPEPDPYDTHPTLRDRLTAVESLPENPVPAGDERAVSLIDDLAGAEREMIGMLTGKDGVYTLKPVTWDEVAERVYLQPWEDLARQQSVAFEETTAASLADLSQDMDPLDTYFARYATRGLSQEQVRGLEFTAIGAALATALKKQGWELNPRPGVGFRMRRGENEIAPFSVLPRLVSGDLTPDTWRKQCEDAGISSLALGT